MVDKIPWDIDVMPRIRFCFTTEVWKSTAILLRLRCCSPLLHPTQCWKSGKIAVTSFNILGGGAGQE